MQRKVEGLENLNDILTLPIGSKFGMFADDSITLFKVAGYLDRVAKASEDPFSVATVIIPTYPLLRRGHEDASRDLVYQDPHTGLMRVLYESDLRGPLMGIPWDRNRAALLPSYLYQAGAAPCFHACFVFMDLPVGSVVTHPPVQNGTKTFFISMIELNNSKL